MAIRDDGFDLCGEEGHRGNWYSSAPSSRFCTIVHRYNSKIERALDKGCGYFHLALCHGASVRWA